MDSTGGIVDGTIKNADATGRIADNTGAQVVAFKPLQASEQRLSWLLPNDTLANASCTRAVLDAFDLRAKYRFGQNFLVNQAIIDKIIQLSQLTDDDYVLEVGPGIGTLTRALLQHANQVCSIECDAQLPRVLHETLAPWLDHWTLIQADALDVNTLPLVPDGHRLRCCECVSEQSPDACSSTATAHNSATAPNSAPAPNSATAPNSAPARSEAHFATHSEACSDTFPLHSAANPDALLNQFPNKLISNLPYAVAATIVLDYFMRFPSLRSATIMVQKEVAQRMCAQPGTKAYGAYTVKLSLFARPVGMFSVAPSNFFPAPHVESTVIRLDRLSTGDAPYQPCELPAITRAIEAAFANRRKTIFNSMRTFFAGCNNSASSVDTHRISASRLGTHGSGDDSLDARSDRVSKTDARGVLANNLLDALHVANIAPDVRGETLSREQFITLGKALLSCGVV